MTYELLTDAAPHTCWSTPKWDGTMQEGCAGCDEAAQHPCQWCGYGEVFTTHNDLAHAENGDPDVPADPPDAWHDSPHLYEPACLDLYHRTTAATRRAILATGRMVSRENTGDVYFTTDPSAESQAVGYGAAIVHVRVPAQLAELDDEFPSGEQHYRVKADRLTREMFHA